MSDLDLVWQGTTGDLAVVANDLARDDSFKSSVGRSLFSWRRADDTDKLPPGTTERYGWWGDTQSDIPDDRYGSRLYLLKREKQTEETRQRAKQYSAEALDWIIEDRATDEVTVDVTYIAQGVMAIDVAIYKPQTGLVEYRFNYAWAAQADRLNEVVQALIVAGTIPDNAVITDTGAALVTDGGVFIVYG